MRQLIIAEKPSVATELANLLGITEQGRGFFVCGDVYVSSCFGHLFHSPVPEFYDPAYRVWSFSNMPIVPAFVTIPKDTPAVRDRIWMLGQFLKDAQEVIHAGDPDNEGQLLVDAVLEHFRYRGPVRRFWASAQDPASLRAAMENLQDNRNFVGMRNAARARSQADWLIGMNGSRAFTLRARAFGHDSGVLAVGRVMTPTLAMVATRDETIAGFRPIPYHVVTAEVQHDQGTFVMRWQPRDTQAGIDADGRLIDTAIADDIVNRLQGAKSTIASVDTKMKTELQPKGLSLAGIGLLASNKYHYTASQTLEICQSLYEKYKLTSYPRTDSEYLPESQHEAAPQILDALRDNLPQIASWIDLADPSIKSRTWDDSKTPVHHGIIPTPMRGDISRLAQEERNIYMLIAQAYIAQFFPVHKFAETTVRADFGGEAFAARGTRVEEPGWKQLYPVGSEDKDDDAQSLPRMEEGDSVAILTLTRRDARTKPPKPFTEGTLPPAMENIYRYMAEVSEADRAALKEGDGIGTPATRGAIIEELKKKGWLTNQGKWLVSTPQGREVIAQLPPDIKSPVLTARFQRFLKDIESGARTVDEFMEAQVAYVQQLIDIAKTDLPLVERPVASDYPCDVCDGMLIRRRGKAKNADYFWGCSAFPRCKFTARDYDGKPF